MNEHQKTVSESKPKARVLVPTDFSDFSRPAVEYAAKLAIENANELHLLHVIREPADSVGAARLEEVRHQFTIALPSDDEFAFAPHVGVRHGSPSDAILRYADENKIDLIVMGTHGRSRLVHFTLGSVTERVVREATCPVVVMGPKNEKDKITLEAVASGLFEKFGELHDAGQKQGWEEMSSVIVERFKTTSAEAEKLLGQLQKREWLRFRPDPSPENQDAGQWYVMTGIDFVSVDGDDDAGEPLHGHAVELIRRARQLRATDIHIDPTTSGHVGEVGDINIRFRIDGRLRHYCRLSRSVGEHLQNQLKTLADLDIADPFHPQEGRLRNLPELDRFEVRITTAPVAKGEAIALRLFDGSELFLALESLGFSPEVWRGVDEMLRVGEGLVLITGPTGAGKSTTVYSMLETLATSERNVVSIEDPVEFPVPFVRQMNVDLRHDLTMISGLKTMLRMDPDVIFVGEIRDDVAARTAMHAAGSGKYVLSTLHTRDVASTITTLRDMGIPDRSIAGNVTGIVNQRLLRRLCPACKQEADVEPAVEQHFADNGLPAPSSVFLPVGCEVCNGTGYRGRIGIFEASLVRGELAAKIAAGASEQAINEAMIRAKISRLADDSLRKVSQGVTSFEEARQLRWLEWSDQKQAAGQRPKFVSAKNWNHSEAAGTSE